MTSILVILVVVVLVGGSQSFTIRKETLRFNAAGKFKIVNFADLHYGEFPGTDRGRYQDGNSTRVMKTLLDLEQPDFVVFTGDLMSADVVLVNPTRHIDACFEAVSENGYKWASTYGNHDNGLVTTREEIFEAESKYQNSYTTHGGAGLKGLTNYFLPIYPYHGDTPLLILWFFDSRGGFDPKGIKPATVDETVVEWFKLESALVAETWGNIPSLAFFHIPTMDYEHVQDNMESHECLGLVDDRVVPQKHDTGFMRALIDSNVLTTFVGHDHGNSWCCKYESIEICYNRRTGYGGYGKWGRGARVVELDSTQDIWSHRNNYVRLENGDIVDIF